MISTLSRQAGRRYPQAVGLGLSGSRSGFLASILTFAVGSQVSQLWGSRSISGASNRLVWNARALAGGSKAPLWNVRSLSPAHISPIWNVRAAIAHQLVVKHNVRALASSLVLQVWGIRNTAGNAAEYEWSVKQLVKVIHEFLAIVTLLSENDANIVKIEATDTMICQESE